MLADLCRMIQNSTAGTSLRESALAFPIVESLHVLGTSFSVGLVVLLDLRLIGAGYRHSSPRQLMQALKPWYACGFALMFATGLLLFISEAFNCYQSRAFRWKLASLALAAANAAVFEVLYKPSMTRWEEPGTNIPAGARLVGWCSLACWAAVIAFGRWTAYRLG